jgi:hypothetical protein
VNSIFAGIRDGDDNQRLNQLFPDQALRRLVNLPFHADEGGRSIENILTVLQIQHGITVPRETSITGRQIDENVATVSQKFGTKTRMYPNVSSQRVFRHEPRRIVFHFALVEKTLTIRFARAE